MNPKINQKLLYGIISIAAAIGFTASFLQMLEKLTLLKNTHAVLACNLSSTFNCTNILNSHQSSVFGFPNSLLCMSFFMFTFSAGLIGWTGAQLNAKLRLIYEFFAVFFVCFGFWYFWQSIFNIGSLCIYCLFCYAGVLAINSGWFRLNYNNLPVNKTTQKVFDRAVKNGADIFFWFLIAAVITLEAILKFA
jgi:uncharacterized membrane protein